VDRDGAGLALDARPDLAREGRVARLPHPPPGLDVADALVGPEPEERLLPGLGALHVLAAHQDGPHAPADLARAGEAALHAPAIAARDRRLDADDELDLAARVARGRERAGEDAAVIARARLDEPLVIHAGEEARAGSTRVRLERG